MHQGNQFCRRIASWLLLCSLIVPCLNLFNPGEARGEENGTENRITAQQDERSPSREMLALAQTAPGGTAGSSTRPGQVLDWETETGKSYLVPAWEIPAFLLLLNGYDRLVYPDQTDQGKKTYSSNLSTTWEHLRRQNWAFDQDPFNVNQFSHPYEGATMYGLARSAGLSFWESWAYSNVGSFLWEMAGETTRPSINDMVTTGSAGSLLGEALFRMAGLVLEKGAGRPSAWEELGAAALSPPLGLNRAIYGDRFKSVFPSHKPDVFWQARLGGDVMAHLNGPGRAFDGLTRTASFDFLITYGLPGDPEYRYRRPLDYFDLRMTLLAETRNALENVSLRGLLYGKEYQGGNDYRGVWGLYGSYDYFSPSQFRVSTTALSVGTTGQLWLAPRLALQESVLVGAGFGAAGRTPVPDGERDYHYGITPQGIVDLRLICGDRAMIDIAAREYFVTGTGSDNSQGSERIFRGNVGLTFRVWRWHGIGVQYVATIRNARYGTRQDLERSDGTASIFYTFLGDRKLGAVDWR